MYDMKTVSTQAELDAAIKAGEGMKIIAPGIYEGVPEHIYHGDSFPAPCLSTGALKHLLMKSPQVAYINHPALGRFMPEEDESKFDIGTAAHSLLLEGVDSVAVIEADSWRTKEAKEARDFARLDGKIPLLRAKYDEVVLMVDAAKRFLAGSELRINDLQAEGRSERTFVWVEDGIWFKARPDWMPLDDAYILDYKTTGVSANPEGIERLILNMGYEIQDWLYKRGVYMLTGKVPRFVFLFQENKAPYLCSLIELSPQFADMGSRAERGIEIWKKCLASDCWPGYPSRICNVEPPVWAFTQWEASQQGEGI